MNEDDTQYVRQQTEQVDDASSTSNGQDNDTPSPARDRSGDLIHLGSPFAHPSASAELIDLWDETDRFFDALGDPHELIGPEGTETLPQAAMDQVALQTEPQERVVKLFEEQLSKAVPLVSEPKHEVSEKQLASPLAQSTSEDNDTDSEADTHTDLDQVVIHPSTMHQQLKQELPDREPTRVNEADQPQGTSKPSLLERFEERKAISSRTKVIVTAGGKGGVGRSLITANLAIILARLSGDEVVTVDLDPLGSNLHTYLGLEPLISTPGHQLRKRSSIVAERCHHQSVVLVRSSQPVCSFSSEVEREALMREALSLQPKWLLIDAGMLPDAFTLTAFANADFPLIVYHPDPASVERGHSFLSGALYRQLIDWGDDASALARSLLSADYQEQIVGPNSLSRALRHMHPSASRVLEERILQFRPCVIVNQCRTRNDRISGEEVCSILKRKWRIAPKFLGAISHHHVVHQSLLERQPLITTYPSAAPSLDLERIARNLQREAERSSSSSTRIDRVLL